MRRNILITAPYFIPHVDRFADFFEANNLSVTVAEVEERLDEEELLPIIGDYDGIICGDDRLTAQVIDAAERLKVIVKWGTGIDSIDSDAAERMGISVCRTPAAFTNPVADTVVGYILCFVRNLPNMDKEMRNGRWEKIPGRALNECTVGVIGLGEIGFAVLRRLQPFGARLLGTDIREIPDTDLQALDLQLVGLEELLTEADFVSLNTDLNPSSLRLIGERELSRMKPDAVIINTSRGPVIDEDALISALKRGVIGGAALDVFEDEPLPASSPLYGMNQVLLAPHNSNSSPMAWERVHRNSLAQLVEHLERSLG